MQVRSAILSEHNESAYLPIADTEADIADGGFVPMD
jgi:hypothetical protein